MTSSREGTAARQPAALRLVHASFRPYVPWPIWQRRFPFLNPVEPLALFNAFSPRAWQEDDTLSVDPLNTLQPGRIFAVSTNPLAFL